MKYLFIPLFLFACSAVAQNESMVQAKLTQAYELASKKDEAELKKLCETLKLPKPDVWFAEQFGPDRGAKLASAYSQLDFGGGLPKFFAKLVDQGRSEVHVTVIQDKEDPNANGNQKEALAAMAKPLPLYSVRFIKPGEDAGTHLYSFVVIDGDVRFLDKMK